MTIEERARKEAPLFPFGFDEYEANYRREEFINGYEIGATEQKAIDEDHLREVTEMLIEKACKAHCGICDFFNCCPYEFEGCPERNEVRKAMEEEA